MSELSDEAKALFSRSRGELTPSEEDLRRVERRVLLGTTAAAAGASSLGVSGAAAAATGTPAATAAVGSASAGLKVLLTFAFAAGLGAGGVLTYRLTEPRVQLVVPSARNATSARSAAPALVPRAADSASATQGLEEDRAVNDAPARKTAPKSLPDSGTKPPPSTEPPALQRSASVAEEARLLREADRALRNGDAEAALALLEQHERAHPGGTLVEERAAERVFALCAGGRLTEARNAAARFLEQYPRSPLAERVRATCAGPTPTR